MRIKSQKDFVSGLVFIAIGVTFAIGATNYSIGTSARMGPGYFPLMLGIVLAIIGAVVSFRALVVETPDGDPIGTWAWKPLLLIIVANFLFGILLGGIPSLDIPAMGLIAAIIVLTIVAAMGGHEFKWSEVLILSVVLAVGSWAVFVKGLGLTFQVWPSFLGN
ncbi:tripartite tricarboxylate transporter TctB family protein [Ottowia sp.]|uniref:tripartite tricarboxylate transporter TctB family protein n=1 Tax=Ottowia sp. TaxID=1898956 RepID=UPI003A88C94A